MISSGKRFSCGGAGSNTLIGCTRASGVTPGTGGPRSEGSASNNYPWPIPLTDVQDRLFRWAADSGRLAVEVPADPQTMTHQGEDGAGVLMLDLGEALLQTYCSRWDHRRLHHDLAAGAEHGRHVPPPAFCGLEEGSGDFSSFAVRRQRGAHRRVRRGC